MAFGRAPRRVADSAAAGRPGTPGRWARRPAWARRSCRGRRRACRARSGLACAGIFASFSITPGASITLSSCVPAWVTQTGLPSAVRATPQGLAAPRSTSSRSTVLTSFFGGRVDDRQGVGVHPAALQLRGRHLVAGEDVDDVDVLAVGRDADPAHARAAVGQPDRSAPGCVAVSIDGDRRRHVVASRRDRSADDWPRTASCRRA